MTRSTAGRWQNLYSIVYRLPHSQERPCPVRQAIYLPLTHIAGTKFSDNVTPLLPCAHLYTLADTVVLLPLLPSIPKPHPPTPSLHTLAGITDRHPSPPPYLPTAVGTGDNSCMTLSLPQATPLLISPLAYFFWN